ncbi:MAG TPA: hypothetical protein VIL44_03590 [Micromonospora sp.]
MAAANSGDGLSAEDVARIREMLAAGRKPKVMFTAAAGQIAGQLGQVVELRDPATSEEWVVVRFGRDELPFSPAEVRIPPKGTSTRTSPPPAPPPPPFAPPPPGDAALSERADTPPVATTTPSSGGRPPARRSKTAKPAAKPRQPGLTVTLSYEDGEWMVSAMQGSKTLARPYVVRPAEALRMVALVDVPGVREAVEQILAAERAEAEQQAQRLRAELAEVEARLAELREAASGA